LSVTATINIFKSESKGYLYAEAHEVFNHKRLANCEVRITNEEGELIATFDSTGYRKDVALPFDPIE
jgi:acyl-CoA thioesterase